ncbi:MAG TPA: heme o synthase [Conexivisphaerales archaeon]|nr:heme o synthase [Conexivisphaerales archaeon]
MIKDYIQLTNPNIVYLLAFTAATSALIAGGFDRPLQVLAITLATGLCSAGARSVTNYIDRDIDAVMRRTRRRPLPRNAIPPGNALVYGGCLIGAGLLLAFPMGALLPVYLGLGLVDNVVVYNLLTKRKTAWNIILGAPSGGIPAFVGYVAIKGYVDWTAVALAALVVLWTPVHIWSLAIRFKDDYGRADIPMLPVSLGVKTGIRCIAYTSVLLAVFTAILPILPGSPFGIGAAIVGTVLSVVLAAMSLWLIKEPTEKKAWDLFKFTSPYLALLFSVLALDVIMGM